MPNYTESDFVFCSWLPSPGGIRGRSGLSLSSGNVRVLADSGPDAWVISFVIYIFIRFCSWATLSRGIVGEGPDGHCPQDIEDLGPIPARIRGILYF